VFTDLWSSIVYLLAFPFAQYALLTFDLPLPVCTFKVCRFCWGFFCYKLSMCAMTLTKYFSLCFSIGLVNVTDGCGGRVWAYLWVWICPSLPCNTDQILDQGRSRWYVCHWVVVEILRLVLQICYVFFLLFICWEKWLASYHVRGPNLTDAPRWHWKVSLKFSDSVLGCLVLPVIKQCFTVLFQVHDTMIDAPQLMY
jgi:hypothetical protein